MRRGQARYRVDIEYKYQTSTNDLGHAVWATKKLYHDVPAMIEMLQGRELESARQQVPEATHRVTMQNLEGVTEEHWVNYCDRILEIGAVNDLDDWMILTCTETK